MYRVYEQRIGSIALATHLFQAYELLLKLDQKRRSRFRVVGVSSYLGRQLGKKVGFAAYVALVEAGLIKSVGRVSGTGKGNFCSFVVYRRRYTKLRVDYREQKQPLRRKSNGHRTMTAKKRVSAVGAYKPIPRTSAKKKGYDITFEPPTKLLIELLKHAGKNPKVLPKRTLVHFIFN